MSDFFGKLKSGAGKVTFEADKMARVNKAQSEIGQFKRQIEALYLKLGEITYQQYANQSAEAPDISEICHNLTELNRQIVVKTEDIQHIHAETYSPQGAPAPVQPVARPAAPVQVAPAPVTAAPIQPPAAETPAAQPAAPVPSTKFCPNCGKEMGLAVKFCPDCGTKMP